MSRSRDHNILHGYSNIVSASICCYRPIKGGFDNEVTRAATWRRSCILVAQCVIAFVRVFHIPRRLSLSAFIRFRTARIQRILIMRHSNELWQDWRQYTADHPSFASSYRLPTSKRLMHYARFSEFCVIGTAGHTLFGLRARTYKLWRHAEHLVTPTSRGSIAPALCHVYRVSAKGVQTSRIPVLGQYPRHVGLY